MNGRCKNPHKPTCLPCKICGAGPGKACNFEDPDWLAWLVVNAVRDLKRVKPDHIYVKAIEDCIDTRQGELQL